MSSQPSFRTFDTAHPRIMVVDGSKVVRKMIEGDFRPGGPAKHQLKDTNTAVAQARDLGLRLPVTELVDGLFADLVAHGDGELDHSALIRELCRRNDLPVP